MNTPQITRALVDRVSSRFFESGETEIQNRIEKGRALKIESLEPRILFSGSPAPAEAAPPAEPAPAQEAPAASEPAPEGDAAEESAVAVPPAATEGGDESGAAAGGDTAIVLSQEEVTAVAEAATQRWIDSGISADQEAALAGASYQIADLDGVRIGAAEGNLVTIDVDAAGRGWFVDQTPGADEEYSAGGAALDAGGAVGGIDLLSVLLHEQGHLLGLDGTEGSGSITDIMNGVFATGERRLPGAGQADGAVAGSLEGVHFALIVEEQFLIDANNYTDGQSIVGTTPDDSTGFTGTDAWTSSDAFATTVNANAVSGGLTYTDGLGNSLEVAGGSLDIFRTAGSANNDKVITRTTSDASTRSAPGDEVWFSMLVDADNATLGAGEDAFLYWDHDLGGATRLFGIGLNANSSNLWVVPKIGAAKVDTGLALQPGSNLVVMRIADASAFVDGSGNAGEDSFELFLNPTLDAAPTGVADYRVDGNFGLVAGSNAGFGFDGLETQFDLAAGNSVRFDEFRLGDTFADVTPYTPAATTVDIKDDFDSYADGANLDGLNDGTGWTTAWTSLGNHTTVQATNPISGSNAAIRIQPTANLGDEGSFLSREFSTVTDTVYVGMEINKGAGFDDSDFINFKLGNGGSEQLGFGLRNNAGNPFFVRVPGSTVNSGTNAAQGVTYQLVAKISKDGSSDFNRIDLYIDPAGTTEPGSADASATTATGVSTLNQLTVRNFNPESGDTVWFDSLRLSDTFEGALADTTPTPLASDSFLTGSNPANGEYAFPGGITGTNPTVDGFTGAWSGNTSTWKISDTGLTHASIVGEAGGSAEFNHTSDFSNDRATQRDLTAPPADTEAEVWVAGLVQLVTTDADNIGYAYAGFGQGSWDANGPITGETEGLLFGVQGDGSEMDLVFRHRTNVGQMTSDVLIDGISAGDTHLVVMKVTANTDLGGGGVSGNDNVSIWVNPTDVTSETSMGAAMMFEDFSVQANSTAFTDLMLGGNSGVFGGVRFDELAIGTALEQVVTAAPVLAAPTLNVDFGQSSGGSANGPIQSDFETFEHDGTAAQTRTYTNGLGDSGTVDVTISGNTHYRDYAAITSGPFLGDSDLLSDSVLRNSNGTMTLTISDLEPGTYEIVTYHHGTQFGGASFDFSMTDALGADQDLGNHTGSGGTAPTAITTLTTQFQIDASVNGGNVDLKFTGGTNNPHFQINGFELQAIADTNAPTITSVFPTDDGTDVLTDQNLEIIFNEDVAIGTGNLAIKKVSDDSVVETIDVAGGTVTVGGGGNVVTIDPAGFLPTGEELYVEIASGAFEDIASNAFAGITGNSTWNFTTVATDSVFVQFEQATAANDQQGWRVITDGAPPVPGTITGGPFDGVSFTATGTHVRSHTHHPVYALVDHTDGDLDNLLSGGVLTNDVNTDITLTLTGLGDGDYEITTYHHTPYTPTDGLNFDVIVDSNLVYDDEAISFGASVSTAGLTRLVTPFTVSGGADVTLTFSPEATGFGASDHLNLNGFQLAVVPPTVVDAVDDGTATDEDTVVTTTATAQVVLTADADAFVKANQATTNFGTSSQLQAKNEGSANTRKTYVRFDVSSAPDDLANAELRFTVPDPAPALGSSSGLDWTFNVWGLNDGDAGENWGEGTIHWNNAPGNDTGSGFDMAANATLLDTFTLTGRGGDGEVVGIGGSALVDFLNQDTDGNVTFMVTRIEPQSSDTVVHVFSSKEDGANAGPELVLSTTVLDNDTPPDATVVAFDATSDKDAAVTVNSDGSFTYDPTSSTTLQALAAGATATDTFTYTIAAQEPIQIDINSNGSATQAGWTGLNLTGADATGGTGGNGESVTVDGVTFTMFTADGHRDRASSTNDLTSDFAFDDGPGEAVGLQVSDLPDGMWQAEVWVWDNDAGFGDVIIAYQRSSGEQILTTSFTPNPDDPFVFTFDSADLPDGKGIFVRENNSQNRSRMNALRLTPLEFYPSLGGTTDTATVTVKVTGVNDAPDADDDTNSTDEENSVGGNVLANDMDVDTGDSLTVSEVNGSAGDVDNQITLTSGALVTLNEDGSYDYDPNGGFETLGVGVTATDTFSYTVEDSLGATDTATVTVTITGVNDPVVAVDDTNTTDEDSSVGGNVLDNDTDVDAGDSKAVIEVNGNVADVGSQITLTSGALVTVNADGTYDYDPNGQFENLAAGVDGTDSFTYTVTDQRPIQIDINSNGSATQAGWTGLDLTGAGTGNGQNVTVDGVTFTMFTADGHRDRASSTNDLTGDFAFDNGSGQAVGLQVSDLPDGLWQAEVWVWDNDVPTIGNVIIAYQRGSGGEEILTTSFTPDPDDPFVFTFDSTDFPDGKGIFVRENNPQNASRINALRLTPLEVYPSLGWSADTATVNVTVNGVNDAPLLGSPTNNFNDVAVNDLDNDGESVADLLNGQATDVDDDTADADIGIAITGSVINGAGGGKFQYSLDGTNWLDLPGGLTDDTAFLLDADDRVRFVPDGTNTQDGWLDFRAWDRSDGLTAGNTADADPNGGTAHFSGGVASRATVAVANLILDGDELLFTATAGTENDLRVSMVGGELVIVDGNGHAMNSGPADMDPSDNGLRVTYTPGQNLIIEANSENDAITLGDMTGFTGSLTVLGGDGFDEVVVARGASVALGADDDLLVDAETFKADLDSSVSVVGDGTIDILASGGVGDFAGLNLRRASLSSEGGGITLTGVGGDTGNTNDGVVLTHGSTVSTGGGGVTITGTATSTTGANDGISLKGGSDITAGGAGGITLTGTSSGVNSSYGVQLFSGTEVTTMGGDIAIVGSSAAVGSRNAGIYTNGATVTAGGAGSVAMTGTGGGAGSNNNGLSLAATAVDAGTSGDVTLVGLGGGGTSGNGGVQVGTRTSVSADGGNVTITGTGGAGTGVRNTGVSLLSGSSVSSGAATSITGVAGTGTSRNGGVSLVSTTVAAAGDLTVDGTGNGTGSYNSGISSSRSTLGGAEVTLAGTGSTSSTTGRFNDGVSISRGGVTASGTLTIDAAGGTGSRDNRGLMVNRAALGGTLAVTGSADTGSGARSTGVFIQNSVLSDDGTIEGTGGGVGGADGLGVYMRNITGGANLGVTTTPDTDDEKGGNYFDAVLPAVLVLGAGAGNRRKREILAGLISRLPKADTAGGEVEVYLEEGGVVGLDSVGVSAGHLAELGVEVPEVSAGKRLVLLLTGGAIGRAAGLFAEVGADGKLGASHPAGYRGELAGGELMGQLAESVQTAGWSAEVPVPARGMAPARGFSEVFGL